MVEVGGQWVHDHMSVRFYSEAFACLTLLDLDRLWPGDRARLVQQRQQ
jgi:hypothetical protein